MPGQKSADVISGLRKGEAKEENQQWILQTEAAHLCTSARYGVALKISAYRSSRHLIGTQGSQSDQLNFDL